MRVLVLGAGGYLGRVVMPTLVAAGMAPVAGVRRAVLGEHVVLDATNEAAVTAALANVDAVVNLVAGDAATITANARAVFAAARAAGKHVVYLSSMAVYGSAVGRVDEDAPLLGDVGPYSAAKVAAEGAAAGGDVTILRPGCIYGARSPQWTVRIARLLEARRVGDLGAAGDGCSNLVHANDVAAAIVAALKAGRTGVRAYNLAMPGAPDWNGYFFAFAKALGAVPIKRVPAWQLKLETKALAIPLKVLEKAAKAGPPAIPPSLLRLWGQDIRLDSTRSSTELAISWTSLSDGISEAVAGLRDSRSRARVSV